MITKSAEQVRERNKDTIRRELVAYLNKFNMDNYPTIEPLLGKAKMDFFAIARGNAVPDEDANCSISYYLLFGREPQVAVFGNGGWTYPIIKRSEVLEISDLGSGRIKLPRMARYKHTIDVVETAASTDTDYNYLDAIDTYRKRIEEDFPRHLDFLKRYVDCRKR